MHKKVKLESAPHTIPKSLGEKSGFLNACKQVGDARKNTCTNFKYLTKKKKTPDYSGTNNILISGFA